MKVLLVTGGGPLSRHTLAMVAGLRASGCDLTIAVTNPTPASPVKAWFDEYRFPVVEGHTMANFHVPEPSQKRKNLIAQLARAKMQRNKNLVRDLTRQLEQVS